MPLLRRLRQGLHAVFAPVIALQRNLEARQARHLAARVAACSAQTSKVRLVAIAMRAGWRVLPIARALAGNPATPRFLLWALAYGSSWDVAALVAANTSTPEGILAMLRNHTSFAVRQSLASNSVAPVDVVRWLARSDNDSVRLHAAAHRRLPTPSVDELLRDFDVYVRAVAANNPNASSEALTRLAQPMTEPAWVLRAVATNPACPPPLSNEILTWIALGGTGNSDPQFDPITCAGHPGDTTVDVWNCYRKATRVQGAERHALWRIRSAITSSWPRIPGEVLMTLAVDPEPAVRRSVAGYKELTSKRLKYLAKDSDPMVAERAVYALRAKSGGLPFWRYPGSRRAWAIPLISIALFGAFQSATHSSPSTPPPAFGDLLANGAGDGHPVGLQAGVPATLPGDGQFAASPRNSNGASVLTISTGNLALGIHLPTTAFTPSGVPIGNELQLLPGRTTTVTVTVPTSSMTFELTIGPPGNLATVLYTIFYEGLSQ